MRKAILMVFLVAGLTPAAATAQFDPVPWSQTMVQVGTNQGYVDRARARQRGERPRKAVSYSCMRAWSLHDRMNRAQRDRLYQLCPR